jgi:hypothetical protein
MGDRLIHQSLSDFPPGGGGTPIVLITTIVGALITTLW